MMPKKKKKKDTTTYKTIGPATRSWDLTVHTGFSLPG